MIDDDESPMTFEGDLSAAQQRLRDLAGAACQMLDARALNLASYHLCVSIESATGKLGLTDRMISDLNAERGGKGRGRTQ